MQIINSISIYQITLQFSQATAYDPAFSTDNTVAAFQLPFAFPIDLTALATQITTVDQGQGFALISVPQSPVTTNVVARTTVIQFSNIPFAVFDNTHSIFSQFLTDTTDDVSKTFGLTGIADSASHRAL